ncbi:transglycosylase SLT domain-containing protein [Pseudomonas aeruginosa]
MKRLLTLGLLGLLSACQPAFATDRIPTAAEQYRRTLVRSAHAEWGLSAPIATFAAQVHQESRWRADARSPVGAQGLAQFMPGTAEWIAGLYPAALGTNQPFNPVWANCARCVTYDLGWLYGKPEEPRHTASVHSAVGYSLLSTLTRWPGVGKSRPVGWPLASGADQLAWFDSVERVQRRALGRQSFARESERVPAPHPAALRADLSAVGRRCVRREVHPVRLSSSITLALNVTYLDLAVIRRLFAGSRDLLPATCSCIGSPVRASGAVSPVWLGQNARPRK